MEEISINDHELSSVKESLRTGVWGNPDIKQYQPFQNELGIVGELVIRGDKLVVPVSLRDRFIQLGHEGHPGESGMTRRLRDRVWWPGMDKQIKKFVASCEGCRLVGLPQKPEPMKRKLLPTEPWTDLAIDFMGPLPTLEYLLVVVDYHSRYLEVEIMTKITATETIERLRKIFCRLGLPKSITLDNAKQFVSAEFKAYCQENGITLNYSIPYWPQQNGEFERQNRSLLKGIQISHSLKRNWKKDLIDYLMMYYSTPHSITGKTPSELMTGRTIRTKIPRLQDIEEAVQSTEFRDRDLARKFFAAEHENLHRNAIQSSIEEGNRVLMQNLTPANKLSTTYSPVEYTVTDKSGPKVTVTDELSGKSFQRNSAHLKKIINPPDPTEGLQDRRTSICSTPQVSADVPVQHTDREVPSEAEQLSRPKRACRRPLRFKDYIDHDATQDL